MNNKVKCLLNDLPILNNQIEEDVKALNELPSNCSADTLILKLKLNSNIRENKRKLLNIYSHMQNISSESNRQLLIDKYINKLSIDKLCVKHKVSRSSIYRLLPKIEEEFLNKTY